MEAYSGFSREDLLKRQKEIEIAFEEYKKKKLNLDMSRGKPCKEQLDLSNDMYKDVDMFISKDGVDCRNYGGLEGIAEARQLFSELLEVSFDEVIIGGNSSLNMMYDTIAMAYNHGLYESERPWSKIEKVKFLCPSPGYDRHFAICELFGMEMVIVPMDENGPDMDFVEKIVKDDEDVKGIWCVPKYSNPTGIVYSDEVVERLAQMETKAKDFRIFWDNAYIVHHLTDRPKGLKNILRACEKAGNPHRVFMYSSTSKITFAGAGLAIMAASTSNLKHILKIKSKQTIGPNKINQLLHVKFFKNVNGIYEHMKKHAKIIKPKFNIVLETLEKRLSGKGIARWSNPEGGYFISLDVLDFCAKEVVSMAKEVGLRLTNAGATYPYGNDPKDSNIRIAPTLPSLEELKTAIEILCICVERVSLKKVLG